VRDGTDRRNDAAGLFRDARFPATRYQGSKRKLVHAIEQALGRLEFDTALDAFGGTGAVAWMLKARGKQVTYNDVHRFNHAVGTALVENSRTTLPLDEAAALTEKEPGADYDDVVSRCFRGVFFTPGENRWIDVTCQNIHRMRRRHRRAIALYALFQACLAKRPFNLFHRANLDIRLRPVPRSFGNKVTWDRPFTEHFLHFVEAANRAVFSNGHRNTATRHDALDYPRNDFDLVYVDTPYMNRAGVGVDYLDFYHFLEGLCTYAGWAERIDRGRKHRPLRHARPVWCDRRRIHDGFTELFRRFPASHLVISYRSDGIPTVQELTTLLEAMGRRAKVVSLGSYKYVLSRNGVSREYLIISERP